MTGDISVIAEEIRSAGFGFAPAEQFRALLTPAALSEWLSFAASWENLGVDTLLLGWGQNDDKIRGWLQASGQAAAALDPVHTLPGENVFDLNRLAGVGKFTQHAWLRAHASPRAHFGHTYLWFTVSPGLWERLLDEDRHLRPSAADTALCRDAIPVGALADGQALASGRPAVVGANGRLGNVGDGNIIQEVLGIPTVQYGPGDIRVYKEWPTPDERVRLTDLVTAAKAVTHATVRLCG